MSKNLELRNRHAIKDMQENWEPGAIEMEKKTGANPLTDTENWSEELERTSCRLEEESSKAHFSTLKDRLKMIRKIKGLTQEQFARRIGIKRNSYANYEIGRNFPIDAVIHSICREFEVYETWLRTGQGEIFRPLTDEERITEWVRSVFSDESAQFQRRFILMLLNLTPKQWKDIEKYAQFLVTHN